jgi:lactate permease
MTSEIAITHGIIGTLMPFLMCLMLTRFFGEKRQWREGFAMFPFALFAGLAFTIPYAAAGILLGPEFPSMLGALIGLVIVVPVAKRGWLLPKEHWQFEARQQWPDDWNGSIAIPQDDTPSSQQMPLLRAWAPYALLAVLLVLTRAIPVLKHFVETFLAFGWRDILGEAGINGSLQPLYLPGGIMVVVVALTLLLHRVSAGQLGEAIGASTKTLISAGFVLVFTIPMVRILINSGVNAADLPSMPRAMAQLVSGSVGVVYPMFAATVGGLGAFIAGSNTLSNLMLSDFQFNTAQLLGVSTAMMVSAQAVGAAAGNMVAIHNIVAASATVGLMGREGTILRMTIIPTLYYLVFAGVITLIAVYIMDISDPVMDALRR